MYPSFQVQRFVQEHFEPVRVHVKEQADAFRALGDRYDAHWTPTTLVLDGDGAERHRIEGFLPADDFLPQLALGVAKTAFSQERFSEAEEEFRGVVARQRPRPRPSTGPGSPATRRPATPGRWPTPRAASASATRARAGRRRPRSGADQAPVGEPSSRKSMGTVRGPAARTPRTPP